MSAPSSSSPNSTQRTALPQGVLGGYSMPGFWRQHKRLAFTLFAVFSFIYGFIYALFGTFLLLQLAVPLLLLAMLVIWMLPDTNRAPVMLLEKLLIAFLIALLCWPDYLALALPGLPWITAIRLVAVPLAIVMLICVSVSSDFRKTMKDVLNAVPQVWKLLAAFSVIALLSIVLSKDVSESVSKFVVAQLYWTLIFFASCYVFTGKNRAVHFGYLIWATVLFVCLIAAYEARYSIVPWAGRIPGFLKIEDENVQKILTGATRAATGIYRTQSKFTTSLGLAEFLALSSPFILHLVVTSKRMWIRGGALLTIPLIFYILIKTDSRLGMVGFFMTFLLYLLAWATLRWRSDKNSIFGTGIVAAYPVIFIAFINATFFIGRLRAMVWGTGAQQFSTDSRKLQFAMGMPKVWSHPWGYGIGQGAETLGFTNLAGVLTIDTYYLLIALEFGIAGFLVYFSMFLFAIWTGTKHLLLANDRETMFIAPLIIALCNFIIIKSIFSQQENHPLVFAMLGAIVALIYKVKCQTKPQF